MSSRATGAVLRPIAVVAVVLAAFSLFNAPFRQFEATAAAGLLQLLGVSPHTVSTRPNSSIAVLVGNGAFLAIVTPACSSLASLLAVTFLAVYVPRRSPGRRLAALGAALLCILVGNVLRIAGSVAVGLLAGTGSLVLFHDWVGSLFAFCYTLGGYLLMLALLLPADRATTRTPDPLEVGGGG
jgi:exosortase/archaeosortase family protein